MERTTLIPSIGRRAVAVGLAALAMSTVACSDDATAPRHPAASPMAEGPSANMGRVQTLVTVRIVDIWSQNVPEKATIRFIWNAGADTLYVKDNAAMDIDLTVGAMKVNFPTSAQYEACVQGGTLHYAGEPWTPAYPMCSKKSTISTSVNLGNVFMRRRPVVTWTMKDEFGAIIPGGSVFLQKSPNIYMDIADGQAPWDEAPALDGKIKFTMLDPGPSVYWETKAPLKHDLVPGYHPFTAVWEGVYNFTLTHEKLIY